MFVDPRHILDDMESNDDDEDEHFESDDGKLEFDGLTTMEQSDLPIGAIIGSSDTINSSTPMERVLTQLATIMQKITNECKEGDVTLYEHATSHMRVLGCNIHNIRLTKTSTFLHPGLMLHHVKDGLGNNVKWFKNLHEIMFNHINACTK